MWIRKSIINKVAEEVYKEEGIKLDHRVGTMIESPAAVLNAAELAKDADFFSFGTNDLTQATLAFSRDDTKQLIDDYLRMGILKSNPFETIHPNVAKLMEMTVKAARKVNPNIEIGICGEHGGEPDSIAICHKLGLDYVGCAGTRIPTAVVASARAKIKEDEDNKSKVKVNVHAGAPAVAAAS